MAAILSLSKHVGLESGSSFDQLRMAGLVKLRKADSMKLRMADLGGG